MKLLQIINLLPPMVFVPTYDMSSSKHNNVLHTTFKLYRTSTVKATPIYQDFT